MKLGQRASNVPWLSLREHLSRLDVIGDRNQGRCLKSDAASQPLVAGFAQCDRHDGGAIDDDQSVSPDASSHSSFVTGRLS